MSNQSAQGKSCVGVTNAVNMG